ncbi:MAG: type IV pilin protein [Lysobacterales bacterium]
MQQQGFTLIEVLIVVTIVAILAGISISGYAEFTERARRSEAKTSLTQAAQGLERCFTRFGVYNNANCDTFAQVVGGFDSEGGWYNVAGVVTASTYALTATGLGNQADDVRCGNYGINELGQKTHTGTSDFEQCWSR